MNYSTEALEKIMKEVGRRINHMLNDGTIATRDELHDVRAMMMQGVYSVIYATAPKSELYRCWGTLDEIWDAKAEAGEPAWMFGR